MKTIRVDVTARDIATGEPGCCSRCPVAKAVRRATGIREVEISTKLLWIGKAWKGISLPSVTRRFIFSFDDHQPVRPFSFKLKIP